MFALRTAGDLLSREYATQKTLQRLFGGGYEVIAPDGERDRFKKVDGITYLFWLVKPNDVKFKLMRAVKTWYVRDLLCIRTADLDDPTMQVRIRSVPYVVLPIDRPIHDEDYDVQPAVPFDSEWMCHHFFMAHPKTNRCHVFPLSIHHATGDPSISFEEEKHQLRFDLQDENEIVEFIKESYSALCT